MSEKILNVYSLESWLEKNPEATHAELVAWIEENSRRIYLAWDITDLDDAGDDRVDGMSDEDRTFVMEAFERRVDWSCSVSWDDVREAIDAVLSKRYP